jgi:hypothetical protein
VRHRQFFADLPQDALACPLRVSTTPAAFFLQLIANRRVARKPLPRKSLW